MGVIMADMNIRLDVRLDGLLAQVNQGIEKRTKPNDMAEIAKNFLTEVQENKNETINTELVEKKFYDGLKYYLSRQRGPRNDANLTKIRDVVAALRKREKELG